VDTKGGSQRVYECSKEFLKGNPVYPEMSFVYDRDKKSLRLKTSISKKEVENPEVTILNSYLGVNRYTERLTDNQLKYLSMDSKSILNRTLKKETNFLKILERIDGKSRGIEEREGRLNYIDHLLV
jgi:hypothetical protein